MSLNGVYYYTTLTAVNGVNIIAFDRYKSSWDYQIYCGFKISFLWNSSTNTFAATTKNHHNISKSTSQINNKIQLFEILLKLLRVLSDSPFFQLKIKLIPLRFIKNESSNNNKTSQSCWFTFWLNMYEGLFYCIIWQTQRSSIWEFISLMRFSVTVM